MMRSSLVTMLALSLAVPVVQATFFEPSRSLGDWAIATDSPLSGDQSVKFRVALKPKDLAKVNEALNAVATPGNPRYRAYLDRAALSALVAPEPAAAAHAEAWLVAGGGRVVEHSALGDWFTMEATVDNIQAMFHTTLTRFKNRRTGAEKVATTGSYEIPAKVDSVIALVAGMNSFSAFRATAVAPAGSAASAQGAPATITPETLASVYGVSDAGSHGSKMGSQAVVEFGNFANFNEADLQDFFTALAPTLEGETCGTAYGNNNGDIRASVEANLDVQYIMAAGAWVNTSTYKITDGAGIEDEMLNYAYIVNNQSNPALVHSISYGEYGGSYDNATDHQFDHELMKMGLAGISVLLASGDNGVGCSATGSNEEFDFPDSPHITMVGATYLDAQTNVEVGATLSSGGFSKDYVRDNTAQWQASAVDAYLANAANVTMPTEAFYAPGRAYPDVAAFGQNVKVYAGGKSESVSGTSCSAPIFAGVVASINAELLTAGQPPLGWLNPWLYANPTMFTDVTSGSNPYQQCDGFQAAPGWDPVTGLGTPLYEPMLAAAKAAYKQ